MADDQTQYKDQEITNEEDSGTKGGNVTSDDDFDSDMGLDEDLSE